MEQFIAGNYQSICTKHAHIYTEREKNTLIKICRYFIYINDNINDNVKMISKVIKYSNLTF